MIHKMNFHTHTKYCDGKNTTEEMVKRAVELGFSTLGFSGHAYTPCEPEYSMSLEDTERYKDEIGNLKVKYADKIDIYCGIEMDYFSETDTSDFDYVIGSVHYLEKDGVFYNVDGSLERFQRATAAFGGDVYSLCEAYYSLVADVVRKTAADIIGHFDLITKFNEGQKIFSETEPRYIAATSGAIDALVSTGKIFEINTGAMARGYRSTPYPSADILKTLCRKGARLIMSSDCHDAEKLDCGYALFAESVTGKSVAPNLITDKNEIPFK